MQTKIRFKLNEDETRHVEAISQKVGLSIHEFCKKAVFYAVNDSYKRAQEMQQNGQSISTDPTTDSTDALGSSVHPSAAFPNQEDAGTSS